MWPLWLRGLRQECHARSVGSQTTARILTWPRIPSYWEEPRSCAHHVRYGSGRGAWRCSRHHVLLSFIHRRGRFPTVLRLMTQYPWHVLPQAWGHPSKAHVPVPPADGWRRGGLLHAISAVVAGGMVRRKRVKRCDRTSIIRRASASHAQPMIHSSAKRRRQPRPCIRGQGHSVLDFLLASLGLRLLPPWRGKVGMGGRSTTWTLQRPAPPPSPSPLTGEGKD